MAFLGIGKSADKKAADAAVKAQTAQTAATQKDLQTKANQQYGQGQAATADYLSQVQGAADPTYANRARAGFESSLDTTKNMIAGVAANPGYNPSEIAGMRSATAAPISAAYRSAEGSLGAHTAITGNAAGYAANVAALARSKGMDMSSALAGLQKNIGDARIQGTQFATTASQFPVQAQQQQQGLDQSQQNIELNKANMYALPVNSAFQNYSNIGQQQQSENQLQNQQTQAAVAQGNRPGFWSKFGSAVKAALPVAASALKPAP